MKLKNILFLTCAIFTIAPNTIVVSKKMPTKKIKIIEKIIKLTSYFNDKDFVYETDEIKRDYNKIIKETNKSKIKNQQLIENLKKAASQKINETIKKNNNNLKVLFKKNNIMVLKLKYKTMPMPPMPPMPIKPKPFKPNLLLKLPILLKAPTQKEEHQQIEDKVKEEINKIEKLTTLSSIKKYKIPLFLARDQELELLSTKKKQLKKIFSGYDEATNEIIEEIIKRFSEKSFPKLEKGKKIEKLNKYKKGLKENRFTLVNLINEITKNKQPRYYNPPKEYDEDIETFLITRREINKLIKEIDNKLLMLKD